MNFFKKFFSGIIKFLGLATLLLVLSLMIGFAIFILSIPQSSVLPHEQFDAVVVFTGGKNRIDSALDTWSTSNIKYLFISGVNPKTTKQELQEMYNIKDRDSKMFVYSNIASSTLSNILETQLFLSAIKARKIILVTSNYHMPRSIALFKFMVSDVELYSMPVFTDNFNVNNVLSHVRLIAQEYIKLLGALIHVLEYYIFGATADKDFDMLNHLLMHPAFKDCMAHQNNDERYCDLIAQINNS